MERLCVERPEHAVPKPKALIYRIDSPVVLAAEAMLVKDVVDGNLHRLSRESGVYDFKALKDVLERARNVPQDEKDEFCERGGEGHKRRIADGGVMIAALIISAAPPGHARNSLIDYVLNARRMPVDMKYVSRYMDEVFGGQRELDQFYRDIIPLEPFIDGEMVDSLLTKTKDGEDTLRIRAAEMMVGLMHARISCALTPAAVARLLDNTSDLEGGAGASRYTWPLRILDTAIYAHPALAKDTGIAPRIGSLLDATRDSGDHYIVIDRERLRGNFERQMRGGESEADD